MGTSLLPLPTPGRAGRRLLVQPHAPLVGLALVSLASLASRAAWLGNPGRAVVGDEVTYVNVARTILGIPVAPGSLTLFNPAAYRVGLDVNTPHPPLAKLLIAGSMKLFGDNPVGWRLPSRILGSAAIVALYWLVRSANGSSWLALGAASLMAVDNLFLVYGRTATIEIFAIPFMLVGTALYLRGRPIVAGLALGIGTLTKEVGVLALFVLGVMEVLRLALPQTVHVGERRRSFVKPLRALALCGAVTVVSYLGPLGAMDAQFSRFHNPITHTEFMFGFHKVYAPSLVEPSSSAGYHLAQPSSPLEWLVNRKVVPLYWYPVPIQDARILFLSEMNPMIIGFALAGLLWATYTAWLRRDQVSFLIVAWCLGTFLPFLVVSTRVGYLYYLLAVLPGICLGVVRLLGSSVVPRPLVVVYCVPLAFFAWYLYPFRFGVG
ncbi:MAG: hypothetical protein DLM54_08530 [Acidimicrobiales bacterium]|nr:MAG: hypothetical protein DLM54_08530 [Acidimicrobiales bacterium]